jgi:hypothetical protein
LLSVELDHEAEFRVIAVAESPSSVWLGEWNLPLGRGQAVCALHVAVVPEFQDRMGAARGGRDDFTELGSPAEFRPAVHRGPQRAFGGEPPPESGRYPAADGVQITGGMHEVEDRLLEERARYNATGKAHIGIGLGRDMNDHPVDRGDPPVRGDRHVDKWSATVRKSLQLSGCLVA